MSTESAFNKRLRPETTFDKIEAILEHLNLPPGFVEFVRKHRRLVTFIVVVLLVTIVAGSLYTSYLERQRNSAASALSVAEEKSGADRIAALEKVAADFSATSSAVWAEIEIAQQQAREGAFDQAAQQYDAVINKEGKSSPLWPLLVAGRAGALEGAKAWDRAIAEYTILQDIKGYETLGYSGVGRIYRQQGQDEKALAVYNNFLLKAGDESRLQADRQMIEAEIARIKMIMAGKK